MNLLHLEYIYIQTIHENYIDSRDESYFQSTGICASCIASDHHIQVDFNLILHEYTQNIA